MRILSAIIEALKRLTVTVVRSPLDIILGLAGQGGQGAADQSPAFIAPGKTSELVAELTNGHQAKTAAPCRESEAVTAIFKLRNGKSVVNLAAVERRDVRDLLIGMPPAQIENLCRAGRPAILKLLKTGDSGVYGVPVTEIARLKQIRAEMAQFKGSKPGVTPAKTTS